MKEFEQRHRKVKNPNYSADDARANIFTAAFFCTILILSAAYIISPYVLVGPTILLAGALISMLTRPAKEIYKPYWIEVKKK